jgi:hypothetical protein
LHDLWGDCNSANKIIIIIISIIIIIIIIGECDVT